MNSRKKILITGGSGFIGTNLIDFYLSNYPDYQILNIDNTKPRNHEHNDNWKYCDIKDRSSLRKIFSEFNPEYVIHLAAKASLSGSSIEDFPDNILGTENIVDCISKSLSVKKFLHTSTQYVNMPGEVIKSDIIYNPYTAYGASKAETEKIVNSASLNSDIVILRPTNIWGPWHSVFPYELWVYLSRRLYIHPGFQPIIKHYGFIGNSVRQINFLIENSKELDHKVYYITDAPIDNFLWMNGFSKALANSNVLRIPKPIWRILAKTGDLLNFLYLRFPMNSERYFRLTVNEVLPYERTLKLMNNPIFSLEDGIKISVKWFEEYLTKIKKQKKN